MMEIIIDKKLDEKELEEVKSALKDFDIEITFGVASTTVKVGEKPYKAAEILKKKGIKIEKICDECSPEIYTHLSKEG